jgi:hypothetical protein
VKLTTAPSVNNQKCGSKRLFFNDLRNTMRDISAKLPCSIPDKSNALNAVPGRYGPFYEGFIERLHFRNMQKPSERKTRGDA